MVDYLFEEFPPLVCPCPCLDESKSKGNYWNCSSFCFLTLGGGEGGGSRLPSGCQVAFPPGAYRAVKIGYFQSQKRAACCSSRSNQNTVTKPGVYWWSGTSRLNQSSSPWSWPSRFLREAASVKRFRVCSWTLLHLESNDLKMYKCSTNVWFICQVLHREMKYCCICHSIC